MIDKNVLGELVKDGKQLKQDYTDELLFSWISKIEQYPELQGRFKRELSTLSFHGTNMIGKNSFHKILGVLRLLDAEMRTEQKLLTANEKSLLSGAFVSNGYVLDFSDKTFSDFTIQYAGIDIKAKYQLSKGKSLQTYINDPTTTDEGIITLCKQLLAYYKSDICNKSETESEQVGQCFIPVNVVRQLESVLSRSNFQLIPDEIEEKIKLISTRNASFDKMTLDERLAELNNLFEYLLKNQDKYINFDEEKVFYGFLSNEDAKKYRKLTQCFRHGSEQSLKERNILSNEKKQFLCDLGVFMAVHIYKNI